MVIPSLLVSYVATDLPVLDDPFLPAAVFAVGVWLLLLAGFAFSTRSEPVQPAAPTRELGAEPPAVVNLLVKGGRLSTASVQATLLDLAARDFLDIEEYGAGEQVVCRLKSERPDVRLEGYSRAVLDHIRAEAVDGAVVAQALTTGAKSRAVAWWKGFQDLVKQDAQVRGLTQPRWTKPMWGILQLAGIVAGGFVVLVAARSGVLEGGLLLVILVAVSTESILVKLFGDQRLTQAGSAAAAHWLGVRAYLEDNEAFRDAPPGAVALWDRYMAYAAAMGLATKATRALPMGSDEDERAWSAYGGSWREVEVAYPRLRIIWGRHPFEAALVGLAIGALGLAIAWLAWQFLDLIEDAPRDAERWLNLAGWLIIALAGLVVAWGVQTLGFAVFDSKRREVDGEILRLRAFEARDTVTYFMAVYDGRNARIRAWRVNSQLYREHNEGELVKALVSRHVGYVHRVEPIAAVASESDSPVR